MGSLGVVVRLLPDGTPDASFGTGGAVEVALTGIGGLALQADGRLVLSGYTGWFGDRVIAAQRLHPDGTPDATFGDGGLAQADLDPYAYGAAVAVQPDGAVLLLAHYLRDLSCYPFPTCEPYDRGYGLVRLLPDGTLDPAFGDGDGATALIEAMNTPGTLLLQPDGKILVAGLVAGLYQDRDGSHPVLARHRADGALDAGFGDGGLVHGAFGSKNEGFWSVAAQPDGRILAAGFHGNGLFGAGGQYDFLLARYLGDAAVAVSAAPTAPATIPPGGGAFAFTLRLANATDQPQTVEVWTEADGPAARSPVLGPRSVTLAPHATLTRTLTQRVPGAAPAGDYVYAVRAGAFPDGSVTSASFPVTKAAGALAARTSGDAVWTIEGWDETAAPASAASEVPAALSLSSASPNPFRGGARITLAVPSAQPVRVGVYDALGREVAVLLDGEAEAGAHALALDGRGLAAGVYVVRAEGAGAVAVRRVVRY